MKNLQIRKEEIRARMVQLRADFAWSYIEKRKLDALIVSKLLEMPSMQDATTVLVYESYKTEVDTGGLIEILHDMGKTVAVPHIESMEPPVMTLRLKNDTRSHVGTEAIECAVIPGIAFDKRLNRIGFGKGFFDRLLRNMKCPKIALAYDFQIVQNVPASKHDEKVSYIITPTKIYE